MSINLLDLAKSYLGNDQLLDSASNMLGENKSSVGSAISALLPTILGSVTQKATTAEGASGIMDLLRVGNFDGSLLNNISGLFSDKTQADSVMNSGNSVVKYLFGDKIGGVVDLISNFSGIKSSSTSSLLSFAAPVLMSLLGKQVKSDGLGVSGLMSLLGGQTDFIKNAMPSGLTSGLSSLLGLGGLTSAVSNMTSNASTSSTTTKTTSTYQESDDSKGGGFNWWWLLIPLALIGLFYGMKGCGKQTEAVADAAKTTTTAVTDAAADATKKIADGADTLKNKAADAANAVVEAVKGSVNAAGDWVYDLGKAIKLSLPGGKSLDVYENSVESRLVKFIEDKSKAVDKTTWFTFDRLYFETGKSVLKKESQAQLDNIAAIMKAYPTVEIKLGGYTDNTGSLEGNKKLSAERAASAMKQLVKLAVDAGRMTTEGYGPEHPVCAANDTPACRAQNRRIDVRVTKK